MKKSRFLTALFSFLAATAALGGSASAGSFGSNPADELSPAEASAWFLGQRTVRWCAPAEEPALAASFEQALRLWLGYLSQRTPPLAPGEPPLSSGFARLPRCDGSEDLALAADPGRAAALAERESYDPQTGWGRGKILADPAGASLSFQFMRALGSIFGCGPAEGTILASGAAAGTLAFDRTRTLLPNPTLRLDLERLQPAKARKSWLGGTAPAEAAVRARLVLNPMPDGFSGEVRRPEGSTLVRLHAAFRPLSQSGTRLLKKFYQGSAYSSLPEARTYSGSVTTPAGEELPALLELGLGKAVRLLYFRDGAAIPLFEADSYAD